MFQLIEEEVPSLINVASTNIDRNRDLCSHCGIEGKLICCDHCPRSYHAKCISSTTFPLPNRSQKEWKCPTCFQHSTHYIKEFSMQTFLENPALREKYLKIFNSTSEKDLPSIGIMLLHMEWIFPQHIPKIAPMVGNFFSLERNVDKIENYNHFCSFNFYTLTTHISNIIGEKEFNEIIGNINNQDIIACGLAPSPKLLSQPCEHCHALRYFRTFCYSCGNLFDIKKDLIKSLHLLPIEDKNNKSSLSELKSNQLDNNVQTVAMKGIQIDIIASSLNSHDALPTGIRSMYLQSFDMNVFKDHGGDQLFLLRNFAACCIGDHAVYSQLAIEELVKRWLDHFSTIVIEDLELHHINDLVEGIHAITQLLRQDCIVSQRCSQPVDPTALEHLKDILLKFDEISNGSTVGSKTSRSLIDDDDQEEDSDITSGPSFKKVKKVEMIHQQIDEDDVPLDMEAMVKHQFMAESQTKNESPKLIQSNTIDLSQSDVENEVVCHIKRPIQPTLETPSSSSSSSMRRQTLPRTSKIIAAVKQISETESNAVHHHQNLQNDRNKNFLNNLTKRSTNDHKTVSSKRAESHTLGGQSLHNDSIPIIKLENESQKIIPNKPCNPKETKEKEMFNHSSTGESIVEYLSNNTKTFQKIVRIVKKSIIRFPVTDLMGFHPINESIPLTPANHCGHCGNTEGNARKTLNGWKLLHNRSQSSMNHQSVRSNHAKNSSNLNENNCSSSQLPHEKDVVKCTNCGYRVNICIDYGSLCDALIWAYVYRDVGIDISLNEKENNRFLRSIIRILPTVRSYQDFDEMGEDFFKLQCYFVTHLIYVFSDWGQHSLHRQLFAEEFLFFIKNMKIAIRTLKDPELVGEFLQCIKILQYSQDSDQELKPIVDEAIKFLVDLEMQRGGKGTWVSLSNTTCYDRYHASYCAAIGLSEYPFSSDDESRLNPPISNILTLF